MTSDRIRLGNATLTRVIETQVDNLPVERCSPYAAETPGAQDSEFKPTFWNDDGWRIAMQIWVIEVDGLTVLIDTGAGNDKCPAPDGGAGSSADRLPRRAGPRGLRPRRRRRRREHPPALRPRRLEHHARGRRVGADIPQRPLSDPRTRLPALPPRRAGADLDAAVAGRRSGAAACPNGVRGQRVSRARSRSSCGPATISSASRCGCGPRRVIRRGRRWSGWTRASRPSSSAT